MLSNALPLPKGAEQSPIYDKHIHYKNPLWHHNRIEDGRSTRNSEQDAAELRVDVPAEHRHRNLDDRAAESDSEDPLDINQQNNRRLSEPWQWHYACKHVQAFHGEVRFPKVLPEVIPQKKWRQQDNGLFRLPQPHVAHKRK